MPQKGGKMKKASQNRYRLSPIIRPWLGLWLGWGFGLNLTSPHLTSPKPNLFILTVTLTQPSHGTLSRDSLRMGGAPISLPPSRAVSPPPRGGLGLETGVWESGVNPLPSCPTSVSTDRRVPRWVASSGKPLGNSVRVTVFLADPYEEGARKKTCSPSLPPPPLPLRLSDCRATASTGGFRPGGKRLLDRSPPPAGGGGLRSKEMRKFPKMQN